MFFGTPELCKAATRHINQFLPPLVTFLETRQRATGEGGYMQNLRCHASHHLAWALGGNKLNAVKRALIVVSTIATEEAVASRRMCLWASQHSR